MSLTNEPHQTGFILTVYTTLKHSTYSNYSIKVIMQTIPKTVV